MEGKEGEGRGRGGKWREGKGRRGGEGVGAPFSFLPPGATGLVMPLTDVVAGNHMTMGGPNFSTL